MSDQSIKTKTILKIVSIVALVFLVLISLSAYFIFQTLSNDVQQKIKTVLNIEVLTNQLPILSQSTPVIEKALNYNDQQNPYLKKKYRPYHYKKWVNIKTTTELMKEINKANKTGGDVQLILEEGIYTLKKTQYIRADHIAITSKLGDAKKVIIQGGKFKHTGIGNLFRVSGKHFLINGVTLQNASFHLIQIAGEQDADYPVIRNCILQDGYQQLLKVSYDRTRSPEISSDFGLIENNIFQYSEGIGPNYYIGGIDLHAGNGWVIRRNTFKDIASPSKHIAEHAVHIWNNSFNNLVEDNIFEDNDRAIGFGLTNIQKPSIAYSNKAGVIRNNLITHNNNQDPYADAAIILESSPDTIIENNRIWMEHDYPNAIEYRFSSTKNVFIKGNLSNKAISSRNGGSAKLLNNKSSASLAEILLDQ